MGLEIIEFTMSVEEAFGIEIADEEYWSVNTVGEFHQLVQRKVGVTELLPAYIQPPVASNLTPEVLLVLVEQIPPWPPSHRPIWDEICAILVRNFEIPPHLITPNAHFVQDLGMG